MRYCYMILWNLKDKKGKQRKGYACFSVQEKMHDWVIGASFCSPNDRFKKDIARKIADGRNGQVALPKESFPPDPAIEAIILSSLPLFLEQEIPTWFKKALTAKRFTWTLKHDSNRDYFAKPQRMDG